MQISAKLESISNLGEVTIEFDPPIVMVPRDWNLIFSQDEMDKLSAKDRIIYEAELQKIMDVQFV